MSVNFTLLCEQAIIEESFRQDCYDIVGRIKLAQLQYKRDKKKDPQTALNVFNVERMNLRNEFKKLIWNQPLNQDGSPIASEKDFDNYVFKKEQTFPGIVLIHSSLLPHQD
jgi:hypothetical protein